MFKYKNFFTTFTHFLPFFSTIVNNFLYNKHKGHKHNVIMTPITGYNDNWRCGVV